MQQSQPPFSPSDLRAYYEANTHAFVKFGDGGQSIHRAVWAPGVSDKEGAYHYVDREILTQLPASLQGRAARVLDLGCGVGASLLWMARHASFEGVGITISPTQANWARAQAKAQGLEPRLEFREASFTQLPGDLGEFDLAYAIEAFVLSPSPREFLQEAARVLRPGARLVLVDDFLSEAGAEVKTGRPARWIREFRKGWMASSLITVAQLQDEAGKCGLSVVEDRDLTSYLELRRPRDLAITALVSVGRYLPIRNHRWLSWLGGNGLQLALLSGHMQHRLVVLERR